MLKKRSVTIRGHATSYSVEDEFQCELVAMARRRAMPLARLVAEIDAGRDETANLSSAIRLFVLKELKRGA